MAGGDIIAKLRETLRAARAKGDRAGETAALRHLGRIARDAIDVLAEAGECAPTELSQPVVWLDGQGHVSFASKDVAVTEEGRPALVSLSFEPWTYEGAKCIACSRTTVHAHYQPERTPDAAVDTLTCLGCGGWRYTGETSVRYSDARTMDQLRLRGLVPMRGSPKVALYVFPPDDRTLWPLAGCHASRGDGECHWAKCPQNRDNEAHTSGRHCPLDKFLEPEEH